MTAQETAQTSPETAQPDPEIRPVAPIMSMSDWATRLGRNTRWLEQKTITAIRTYADHHRQFVGDDPDHADEITEQLNLALRSQLEYATYLAERSTVSDPTDPIGFRS